MLAVGLPKPPLAENFDFEVGRLPIQMSSDVSGSAMLLDGEVIVGNGSVESFNVLLRRARLRGRSTSNALPATFVAFDLLWHEALDRTQCPLEKRRSQLRAIVTESERFAVSRVYADRDSGNECRDRRVALERDTGTALPRTSS
jgi:ATP-dependent DNA ligase